jgi:hypothetical protein
VTGVLDPEDEGIKSPLKLQELSADYHVSEDLNHHVISPVIRICVICSDVIHGECSM